MGIPTLARKIMNEYPSTHYFNTNEKFTDFYFDYNCLIYQVHGEQQHITPSPKDYALHLIEKVIEYTIHLIELVNPSKLVYIAFDGTVPRAKMITQRGRRYKTLLFNEYKTNTLKMPKSTRNFETDAITPGTLFITELAKQLAKRLKQAFPKLQIILSDASVPGEGEHKFFAYIKQQNNTQGKICVYGQDADLIMLSLTTDRNIVLLRPVQSPPSALERERYKEGLYYLKPQLYTEKVFEAIGLVTANNNTNKNTSKTEREHLVRMLDDYIFYTFLLGNDFVPRIRILKLKEGKHDGLSTLVTIYKKIQDNAKNTNRNTNQNKSNKNNIGTNTKMRYLTNGQRISNDFMRQLFKEIAINEHEQLKNQQRQMQSRLAQEQEKRLEKTDKTPEEEALEEFEHGLFINPNHPLYGQVSAQFAKLDYMSSEWKEQYYQQFFHTNIKKHPEYLETIIRAYLKTLKFTLMYYLGNEPPDWDWYFPAHVAPLAQDISNFLEKNRKYDINKEKFDTMTVPYSPYEQMMMNLPPERARVYLPPKYVKLMTDINSPLLPGYPTQFTLDVLQGEKFIYAEPKLPPINHLLLKQLVKPDSSKNSLNRLSNEPIRM